MIVKLCSIHQLPAVGSLKGFTSPHADLCVSLIDGRPVVLHNRCPHAGARLSEGSVHGDYVRCPLHAIEFNLIDGSPRQEWMPAAVSFEARMYGEDVFVLLPSSRQPPNQ
jgi:nitrite reductase/ring-hydroxylating ferredoxin subunit